MLEKLETIYRDHRQGLFTLALSITRNPQRAEDAVHDAFARLCRGRTTPAGDPVSYVYAAVRNASIDIIRRRIETPMDTSSGTAAGNAGGAGGIRTGGLSIYNGYDPTLSGRSADAVALAAEREQLVREAVDALPEPQRQVLVMKLYADLTFDQIAKALGEPLSTVASRYRRTLERLKETLDELQ